MGRLNILTLRVSPEGPMLPLSWLGSRCFLVPAILALSSLAGVVARAQVTVTFRDGDLGNWKVQKVEDTTNNGTTFTAIRRTSGGLPDSYLEVDLRLSQMGLIGVAHWRDDFVYDPQSSGPISSIEYYWDLIDSRANGMAFSLLVKQGESYYQVQRQDVAAAAVWRRWGRVGLRQDAFVKLAGEGPDRPDLTKAIQLGFWTRLSTPTTPATPVGRTSGIDNVTITIVKTPVPCAQPPAGMLTWWRGDGDASDRASDHDGALRNTANFSTGFVGQGFSFPPPGQPPRQGFVEVPDHNRLDFSQSFTIDAWIYLNSYPTELAPIVSKWNDIGAINRGYFLAVAANARIRFDISATGLFTAGPLENDVGRSTANNTMLVSHSVVPTFAWNHVTAVFDSTNRRMQLYVNGERDNGIQTVFTGGPRANNEPLLIGAGDLGSNVRDFVDGIIDEVEIFGRALSDDEVRQIFQARYSGKCTVQPVGTVSAASFVPGGNLAPDSIASAFAQGIATEIGIAQTVPLPTELAGVAVRIVDAGGAQQSAAVLPSRELSTGEGRDQTGGVLAPLFFVSPGQINFLVPPGLAPGLAIVTLERASQRIAAGTMRVAPLAPSLFSADASGSGAAAASFLLAKADQTRTQDFVFDLTTRAAVPLTLGAPGDQLYLLMYGTGMRAATGAVTATIGGESVAVAGPVPQPQFVGLDQINLGPLPRSLAGRGEVDIVVTVDGLAANTVRVSIR
jgi:uncharacterized protein (TIGR03437 family)